MLKMDDIKERAVEACQRGKTVIEDTFVRRHSIPGGAALVRDCARAIPTVCLGLMTCCAIKSSLAICPEIERASSNIGHYLVRFQEK